MSVPTGYGYGPCRLIGHAWHEVPSDWTPEYGVPMTLRCERCNMERRDTIGRWNGEVESRTYVQPDGYHIDADTTPRRVDFRLAWLDDHIERMRQNQRDEQRADRRYALGLASHPSTHTTTITKGDPS